MPNVYVCAKWVLDESDFMVGADGSVNTSRARYVVSEYDKNAIAAAVQIAKQLGGSAIGVTFGPDVPKAAQKDMLSRGIDKLIYVKEPLAEGADAVMSADVLAGVLAKQDDCAVVVCAEGSQDAYARQVPVRIAAALDLPLMTSVAEVSVADGAVRATRHLDDSMQVVECATPAVVAVLPEACAASIPSMKEILGAGKKPVDTLAAADVAVELAPLDTKPVRMGYIPKRKGVVIEGTPEEMALQLKDALFKEGVL